MKGRLLTFISTLLTTLITIAQSDYQVFVQNDFFLTVSKPLGYEYEQIRINITNDKNQFFIDTAIQEDQELNFIFPDDFQIELIDSLSLNEPSIFKMEIFERKRLVYDSELDYDNNVNGLLQPKPINLNDLEKFFFRGNYIDGYSWFDKKGEHLAILSSQIIKDSLTTTYLYLNHYKIEEEHHELTRQYVDTYRSCADSLAAQFYLPTFNLTDVDRDSVGEVSIIYQVNCLEHSDRYISYKMLLDDNGRKYMGYYKLDNIAQNKYWGDSYAKSKPIFNRFLNRQLKKFCEKEHNTTEYGDQ